MSHVVMPAPASLFDRQPLAFDVFRTVRSLLEEIGDVEIRMTASQVAFRNRRAFAYVWSPQRWLGPVAAEAVVSIVLDHRLDSSRFREVVEPRRGTWMHHLAVRTLADLDDEVTGWLAEAWARAGAA